MLILFHDNFIFQVIEIDNDEEVRQLPVHKRGCRFPDEPTPNLKAHSLYSYSTCIVQCHADAQMRFCNCTHHLMPNMRKYNNFSNIINNIIIFFP